MSSQNGSGLASHHPVAAPRAPCKCCGAEAPLFGVVDFAKSCEDQRQEPLPLTGIPVYYYRCPACGFLFTTHLDDFSPADLTREIYNADFARVDPDSAEVRPERLAELVEKFFGASRARMSILDYGSATGRMAEILSGKGYNLRSYNPLTDPAGRPPTRSFDLVTAFEVLQHAADPAAMREALSDLVKDRGLIFFTTTVQPEDIEIGRLGWWYAAPRNGHVSLHTRESLKRLWGGARYRFASINDNVHVAFREVPDFASHFIKLRPIGQA